MKLLHQISSNPPRMLSLLLLAKSCEKSDFNANTTFSFTAQRETNSHFTQYSEASSIDWQKCEISASIGARAWRAQPTRKSVCEISKRAPTLLILASPRVFVGFIVWNRGLSDERS